MAYLRDGRAPVPKNPRTSALMSRIRSKDTGPELILRSLLRNAGHTGYRLHYKRAPGRPDIAFVGQRIAVFVHGCFWHSCPHCQPPRPKTNTKFWHTKLDTNKARDQRKRQELRGAGWQVITVWECQLRKRPMVQLGRVVLRLRSATKGLNS